MYPYELFLGINLYDIFLLVGILSAIIVYDKYISKRDVPNKVRDFYLIIGVVSIVAGLFGAGLFQSVFNYIKTGEFVWGGLTFYGGVICGVIMFFICLFAFGRIFFKEGEHLKNFKHVYSVAPCSITIAHAFGRIGCLFAGCCHGERVEGFPQGLFFPELNGYYVPLQLYESLFLFALFFLLSYLFMKKKEITFPLYLISYGVWRFIIEFFRADERGAFLPNLSPAQAISIFAILIGISLFIIKFVIRKGVIKKQ